MGRVLVFWPSPISSPERAAAQAQDWQATLAVNPFKNRRILASAALRRGDDFGMVPPI